MKTRTSKAFADVLGKPIGWFILVLLLLPISMAADDQHSEAVLYSFTGGTDGASPLDLLAGPRGVLYGVTEYGGDPYYCPQGGGCGTVYQLSPPSTPRDTWNKTIIFEFNGPNGSLPYGALISDEKGNLYGTTLTGGAGNGIVYELSPPPFPGGTWTETVLHYFSGYPADGHGPSGRLFMDKNGNLFGTTLGGGIAGCGTVFELASPTQEGGTWNEKIILDFGTYSGFGGSGPNGGLVQTANGVRNLAEPDGSLFGTTYAGGSLDNGGVVFQLLPPKNGSQWTMKLLHVFEAPGPNSLAGAVPSAGLYMDSKGNLFGTTTQGGILFSHGGRGSYGTAYELSPPSQEGGVWGIKVIYAFTDQDGDGYYPSSYFVADDSGALYSTTSYGGSNSCLGGCGTAFKLENIGGSWVETVLHDFRGPNEVYPGGLLLGSGGVLFGTTNGSGIGCNGQGCGTVFELK